jgi:NAD(P)-dependent dehydrogenase (short-subunit alcohol dehydrogenase family)
MEWRDQVAVVTGGARGLGCATARLLAQCGAAVCVNYAEHADAAKALTGSGWTTSDTDELSTTPRPFESAHSDGVGGPA